jgi:hypothetical protein
VISILQDLSLKLQDIFSLKLKINKNSFHTNTLEKINELE